MSENDLPGENGSEKELLESAERQEEELRKAMDDFQPPAGMGNTVEMAREDPPEVQPLRREFQSKLAECQSLEQQRQGLIDERWGHYFEVRQEPQDDVLGVAESWAKAHGTERDMFSETDKAEIETYDEKLAELREEMDSLSERIKSARNAHYGYPRSDV